MTRSSIVRVVHWGASAQFPENTLLAFLQAIVRECQLTGLALWPCNPDGPDDIRQVLLLSVHGIMTNRSDMLKKVLHEATI